MYKINEKELVGNELEDLLKDNKIKPIGKHELTKIGWTELLEECENLTEKTSGAYCLKMKKVEKVIPSSIVKEKLEKEVKEREKSQGKKLPKAEKDDIKEAIIISMAEKAFEKSSYTEGYIDYKNKLLIVDASSPSKADEFTSLLRATLGSLDAEIIIPDYEVIDKMTSWISNPPSGTFALGESCTLKDMHGTGAKVSVSKQELDVEEIENHINSGKMVESIELCWQERVNFTLTSDFKIKKVKFLDIVTNQAMEDLGDSVDEYAKFQSLSFIMVEDFAEIISDLEDL